MSLALRRLALAASASLLAAGAVRADTGLAGVSGRYTISSASQIGFSVSQVGGGGLSGSFPRFSGAFDLHPRDVARSRVLIRIRPGAVVTGHERSEDFLRSSAVFDTQKFPVITFRSISVRPDGPKSAAIDGMLTARGTTHRETFHATLMDRAGSRVTFHVTGKVLRSPYGMDIGTPIYSNVVQFDMTLVGTRS